MTTAVFILNRAPTKALTGKTPFEAWYGSKPNVSFLRTLGCISHVEKTKPNLTKLEDRSTPMVFLGYAEGTKAYRLYDPRGDKVTVSHVVVFNEEAAWDWHSPSTGEAGGFTNTFVVEHLVIHGGGDAAEQVPRTLGGAPSTPAVESSTSGAVLSTSGGMPSTLGVEPGGSAVVATTSGRVPSTPVAEPRRLTVVPTTPRLRLGTPTVWPNTAGVMMSSPEAVPSTSGAMQGTPRGRRNSITPDRVRLTSK